MALKRPPFTRMLIAAALASLAPAAAQAAPCAPAGSFVVDSAGDVTADDGVTTLREAVAAAAANAQCGEPDRITFDLPATDGVATITLADRLYIADYLDIDGEDIRIRLVTTNTSQDMIYYSASGDDRLALYLIELDGQSASFAAGYGGLYASLGSAGRLLLDGFWAHDFDTAGRATVRIHGGSTVAISHATFEDNVATSDGGGLYLNGNRATTYYLDNVRFVGNSAARGGGLHVAGDLTTLEIADSSFIGNTSAGDGGAVTVAAYVEDGMTIGNTTFSGNSATTDGGAINYPAAALTLLGCTFTDNAAGGRGGALLGDAGASLSGAGTVIAGNTADTAGTEDLSGFTDLMTAGTNFVGGDPMLGALKQSSFGTYYHMPLADSPLVNALDEPFDPDYYGTYDALGRERGLGGGYDIGAVEYVATPRDLDEDGLLGNLGSGVLGLLGLLALRRRR